jgi:Holliday junction DNA helicase RuvA
VSGFGPKLALSILSVFPPDEFVNVLQRSDVKALTTIPGVGEKGAKRLVLELQEKLVPTGEAGLPADLKPDAKSVFAEAREALVGLGYSPAEASRALEEYPSPDGGKPPLEDVIKYALKNLSSV